jgi:hypothetical protein
MAVDCNKILWRRVIFSMVSLSLLHLLGNLGGDSIHVSGTLLGEGLSVDGGGSIIVLVGNLADKSSGLELHHGVPDALSSGDS